MLALQSRQWKVYHPKRAKQFPVYNLFLIRMLDRLHRRSVVEKHTILHKLYPYEAQAF